VRFVVDKVAVGQVFLRVLHVPLLLSIRPCYVLIYTLLLPEGQTGQAWHLLEAVLFLKSESFG